MHDFLVSNIQPVLWVITGLLMFVFAALGPATGNMDLLFVISMFGELFMVLFYYLYVIKDEKLEENNKSEYYDEEKAVS